MKLLLIGESRKGKLLDATYELLGFAGQIGAASSIFLIGGENILPEFEGRLYLADASKYGDYNPEIHKKLIFAAIREEEPDYVVFSHSSYGFDLAPRLAAGLKIAQVSEVQGIKGDSFEVPCLNGKMRRAVKPFTTPAVLTIQPGAFAPLIPGGAPHIKRMETTGNGGMEFLGYEAAQANAVDLGRTKVIVAAGRGVGKRENIPAIAALAKTLGGEVAASRPVVDAGWVEQSRQVGASGQTVAPALYVACGISGAIQHIAGMKGSGFIVAINRDRDAPLGEVADVMVVADLIPFVTALTDRLKTYGWSEG